MKHHIIENKYRSDYFEFKLITQEGNSKCLRILQMFNTNWQKQYDMIGNEMKETDSKVSECK
jgi:hypothetical protein